MDCFHVQGVAQDKRNVFLCTEVGNPIPGEDTLNGNDNVFAVGSNGLQKYIRVRFDVTVQNDFSLCVENTEVHTLGVEINSTEKFVLLGVKSHTRPPFEKFFRLIHDTALRHQGGLNEYQVAQEGRGISRFSFSVLALLPRAP